jgi:hypothetical protein
MEVRQRNNVIVKEYKGVAPFITNFNTTTTIPVIASVFRVSASINNVLPYSVSSCVRQTVNRLKDTIIRSTKASASLSVSIAKIAKTGFSSAATVTLTEPYHTIRTDLNWPKC